MKLEATGLGDGSAIRIQGLREREEKDDSKVWGGHSLEGGTPLPMMGQPGSSLLEGEIRISQGMKKSKSISGCRNSIEKASIFLVWLRDPE